MSHYSQLIIFKLPNGRTLPALAATTTVGILVDSTNNHIQRSKKPAIDVNIGETIIGAGTVIAKYIYSLTQSQEATFIDRKSGKPMMKEDYV